MNMGRKTSSSFEGVAIMAPVTFGYERYSDHGAQWFIGQTLKRVIESAGVAKQDVDGLAVASFSLAPDNVVTLTEYLGLGCRWLEALPFGGASGVIAMKRAARAIQAGDANIVACIAGDTHQKGGFGEMVANFSGFTADAVHPYGGAGPNAPFSLITQHYMDRFGTTREDFGRLCIAQRGNAAKTDHALLKEPLTMEDYLGARHVAGPLHLYDCVMPCAGAEGFLVTSVEHARASGQPFVTLEAAEERFNAYAADPVQIRSGWSEFRDDLYGAAGVAPADLDFVETYDDYPVISFMQLEALGLAEEGRAVNFFAAGNTPHNTSGGQLSCGQAGAAGGLLGTAQCIRQLTNEGSAGANLGLVSGYGMINYDRGLASAAAILKRGAA